MSLPLCRLQFPLDIEALFVILILNINHWVPDDFCALPYNQLVRWVVDIINIDDASTFVFKYRT